VPPLSPVGIQPGPAIADEDLYLKVVSDSIEEEEGSLSCVWALLLHVACGCDGAESGRRHNRAAVGREREKIS
jgi:hypothetical protein